MKLYEFYVRNLDEVRQASANLKQFADSPEAEGMIAGFEAELCFKNALADIESYDDFEPEMDTSDDPRPDDIDEIIDFFSNSDSMGRRELDNLRNELENSFSEWAEEEGMRRWDDADQTDFIREYILNNDWDWDEKIEELLLEAGHEQEDVDAAIQGQNTLDKSEMAYVLFEEGRGLAEEALNEMVEASIETEDTNFDSARDEFEEEFRDEADQSDWLSYTGMYSMSDIPSRYTADWPYWTNYESDVDDYFSKTVATRIAKDFYRNFNDIIPNLTFFVSDGHGSEGNRGIDWIFEADSSLTPNDRNDDMAMEIVTPKMSLTDCLDIMPKFFKWANRWKAYSNEDTGFHMSVSVPSQDRRTTDYTKLALFLGDVHVLKEFDRLGNGFCESAMMKIKSKLKNESIDPEKALDFMKQGLDKIASELIAPNQGFGKYTSINPKSKYIEFRSAGNENYEEDVEKLQNTLRRYAQAMYIASDPSRERKAYQKKLFNLLKPTEKVDPETAKKLASFSAGRLSAEDLDVWLVDLKKKLYSNKMDRVIAKGDTLVKWTVTQIRQGEKFINVLAKTKNQAIQMVMGWIGDTNSGNITNYTASSDHQAPDWANMASTPLRIDDSYGNIELYKAETFIQDIRANSGMNLPSWSLIYREDPDPGADWRVLAIDFQSAEEIAVTWLNSIGKNFYEYELKPRNEAAKRMMPAQPTNEPASATPQQIEPNVNDAQQSEQPTPHSTDQTPSRTLPSRSLYRVKNLRTQYEVEPLVRFASPDEAIEYVKDAFSYFFNEDDPCEAFEI